MDNVLALLKNVGCFVFDMDGVLTDGSLLVMPGGVWVRRMNIKDGYALQLAVKKGYQVIIISGSNSEEVKERLNRLGISEVHMNIKDKAALLQKIINTNALKKEEVLCMGDDIPDLKLLKDAGVACCPADAISEIKSIAQYISPVKGGEGCVRDVIEKVMKLRGDWHNDTSVASK
jgi:3-deoxy-D-manno-octulosonate 8-phosphate phosphatase (KDO 8-P phosphatase)